MGKGQAEPSTYLYRGHPKEVTAIMEGSVEGTEAGLILERLDV